MQQTLNEPASTQKWVCGIPAKLTSATLNDHLDCSGEAITTASRQSKLANKCKYILNAHGLRDHQARNQMLII